MWSEPRFLEMNERMHLLSFFAVRCDSGCGSMTTSRTVFFPLSVQQEEEEERNCARARWWESWRMVKMSLCVLDWHLCMLSCRPGTLQTWKCTLYCLFTCICKCSEVHACCVALRGYLQEDAC